MFNSLEKRIWAAGAVLLALLALLGVTLLHLGGRVPALKPLGNGAARVAGEWPTPAQVAAWFDRQALTRVVTETNAPNPFLTLYFQPPPPPTTRPVELIYLGYLEGSANGRRAFLQVDQETRALAEGAVVVADHRVHQIASRTLVLTNQAGITNVLEFNIKKVLVVPAT
jgi:hypothetical protein